MARLLTVRDVCERALRKIGAYSIRDTGARADEMDEARHWLDMVIGHVASLKRTWWLVPSTLRLTLTPATAAYNLRTTLSDEPAVQHVVALHVVDLATNQNRPLPILRRTEWEGRDKHLPAGPACAAWIDRTRDPVLHLHPAPPSPVAQAIDVTFQRFAPDRSGGTWTQRLDEIRDGWNLYLVTALAAEIGDGPVRKLPGDEVRAMKMDAKRFYEELLAYDDHEQADEPRLVEPYAF